MYIGLTAPFNKRINSPDWLLVFYIFVLFQFQSLSRENGNIGNKQLNVEELSENKSNSFVSSHEKEQINGYNYALYGATEDLSIHL